MDKHGLQYTLLSDSSMAGARALGIAFQLDDETVRLYKEKYRIDIEADSGHSHHQLPVPSVFLVDRSGTIRFSYVNPDYKVRVDPNVIMAAAKAMMERHREGDKAP